MTIAALHQVGNQLPNFPISQIRFPGWHDRPATSEWFSALPLLNAPIQIFRIAISISLLMEIRGRRDEPRSSWVAPLTQSPVALSTEFQKKLVSGPNTLFLTQHGNWHVSTRDPCLVTATKQHEHQTQRQKDSHGTYPSEKRDRL